MSKVVEKIVYGSRASHIVMTNNGKTYYVDTNDTFDAGPETMVFPFDIKKHEVLSWRELYVKRYPTMVEALFEHGKVIADLENYIQP